MSSGIKKNRSDIFRQILSKGGAYSLGNFLQQTLNFFLIPVYTAYLSPEDYGIIGLMTITAGIILAFTKAPAAYGFVRFYYSPGYESKRKEMFFGSVVYSLGHSLVFALVFLLAADIVSDLIYGTSDYINVIYVYAFIIFLQPLEDLSPDLLKLQKKALLHVVVQLSGILISAGLVLYLLIFRDMTYMSLVYCSLALSLWPVLVLLPFLIRNMKPVCSLAILSPLLRYGYPMIFTALSVFVIQYADQYIINIYRSLDEVGLYNFAYKIGMLISFFLVTPLQNIINPVLFELEKKPGELKLYLKKSINYLFASALALCLGLCIFSREIVEFIATKPSFHPAWKLIPPIAFSYVLFGMGELFGKGIAMAKKTGYYGSIYFISAAINIALNFLLVPRFGAAAAAWTTLISFIILTILLSFFSVKHYSVNIDFARLTFMILVAVSAFILSILIDFNQTLTLVLKIILLILPSMIILRIGKIL